MAVRWGCFRPQGFGAGTSTRSVSTWWRFLLGVATEAGFLPGMLLYMTYWFPREAVWRVLPAHFMILHFNPLSRASWVGHISSLILGTGHGVAGSHTRPQQWPHIPAGRLATQILLSACLVRAQNSCQTVRRAACIWLPEGREGYYRSEPGDRGTVWPAGLVVRLARPARTCACRIASISPGQCRFQDGVTLAQLAADRGQKAMGFSNACPPPQLCRSWVVLCGVHSRDDAGESGRSRFKEGAEKRGLACRAPPLSSPHHRVCRRIAPSLYAIERDRTRGARWFPLPAAYAGFRALFRICRRRSFHGTAAAGRHRFSCRRRRLAMSVLF